MARVITDEDFALLRNFNPKDTHTIATQPENVQVSTDSLALLRNFKPNTSQSTQPESKGIAQLLKDDIKGTFQQEKAAIKTAKAMSNAIKGSKSAIPGMSAIIPLMSYLSGHRIGEKVSPTERLMNMMNIPSSLLPLAIKKSQGKSQPGELWDTLKGNKSVSFTEVLPNDMNKYGKFALGTALDTLVTPSVLMKGAGVTKKGDYARSFSSLKQEFPDIASKLASDNADDISQATATLTAKGIPQKIIQKAIKAKGEELAPTLVEQAKRGQWHSPLNILGHSPQKLDTGIAKFETKVGKKAVPLLTSQSGFKSVDSIRFKNDFLNNQEKRLTTEKLKNIKALEEQAVKEGSLPINGASSVGILETELFPAIKNHIIDVNSKGVLSNTAKTMQGSLKDIAKTKGKHEAQQKLRQTLKDLNANVGGKTTQIGDVAFTMPKDVSKGMKKSKTSAIIYADDVLSNPQKVFKNKKTGEMEITSILPIDGRMQGFTVSATKDGNVTGVKAFSPEMTSFAGLSRTQRKKYADGWENVFTNDTLKLKAAQTPKEKFGNAAWQLIDDLEQSMANQGVNINEPMSNNLDIGYFPHMEVGTLQDQLPKATGKAGRKVPSRGNVHNIRDEYRWLYDPTDAQEKIVNVEDWLKKHKGLGVKREDLVTRRASVDDINKVFPNLFSTDAIDALTGYAAYANKKSAEGRNANAFIDIAKRFGKTETEVNRRGLKNFKRPEFKIDLTKKDADYYPEMLKGAELYYPKEVADYFTRVMSPKNKGAIGKIGDTLSKAQGAWVRHVLYPWPGYHFRNSVGDNLNIFMGGENPARGLKNSFKIGSTTSDNTVMRGIGKALYGDNPTVNMGVYGDMSTRAAKNMMSDLGVTGTNLSRAYIDNVKPQQGNLLKRSLWDLEPFINAGNFLEDGRRSKLFNNLLQQGYNAEDATRRVWDILYNYRDVPEAVNEAAKYMPFIRYPYKNTPRQFYNMTHNPSRFMLYPKTLRNIEKVQDREIPKNLRGDYYKDKPYIGDDKNGNPRFINIEGYFPQQTVFEIPKNGEDLERVFWSSVTPLLSTPYKLATNNDLYRRKPIDSLRPKDSNVLDMVKGNERTNYLGMSMPTTYKYATDMLPFSRALQTVDKLNPFGIFDQHKPNEQGQTRGYHFEYSTPEKIATYLTGARVYPVDENQMLGNALRNEQSSYSREPGVTRDNITAALRTAQRNGDKDAMSYYMQLFDDYQQRMKGLREDINNIRQNR